MGASNSKPGSSTKHVFASDTPVQFSQELIDSLQASTETNSTRAKTLDLHIAQRVAAELEKIQSHESEKLAKIRGEISAAAASSAASSSSSSDSSDSESSILPKISPKDLLRGGREDPKKSQSTQSVTAEIEKLKTTLSQRKILAELPKEVAVARDQLVGCLRLNDRRPLDCWREVEAFKREVGRLEEKFVGDVL